MDQFNAIILMQARREGSRVRPAGRTSLPSRPAGLGRIIRLLREIAAPATTPRGPGCPGRFGSGPEAPACLAR
jgi:hypothetical protein